MCGVMSLSSGCDWDRNPGGNDGPMTVLVLAGNGAGCLLAGAEDLACCD